MNEQLAEFIRALSTLLGWLYVLCWSLSFYPQPILNWRRKSTTGLTIDFPTLNVLGFVSYTLSTSCFLYSPKIREQYALRHPLSPMPTVRFNDFAFAVHALVLVVLAYSQFFTRLWGFHVPKTQRTSTLARVVVIGSIIAVSLAIIQAAFSGTSERANSSRWTWIDVIYVFGHIKLVATFVKYAPQAWTNYQRKSTEGWSIGQILFDFAGGILSLAQLFIDSSFQCDWSGIIGNPAKLGLAIFSLFFDVVFITQHYVLYSVPTADRRESREDNSRQPLLER